MGNRESLRVLAKDSNKTMEGSEYQAKDKARGSDESFTVESSTRRTPVIINHITRPANMNDINQKKTLTNIDVISFSKLSLFFLVCGSVLCAGSSITSVSFLP